jgi:hypothetical protein
MAATVAVLKRLSGRNSRETICTFTGDSSYPTGGEAITAAQFAALMPEIGAFTSAANGAAAISFFASEVDASGRHLSLDRTNAKILAFDADSEIPAATDLSAVTIRFRIVYQVQSP